MQDMVDRLSLSNQGQKLWLNVRAVKSRTVRWRKKQRRILVRKRKSTQKKERGHPSLRSTVSVFAIYLR